MTDRRSIVTGALSAGLALPVLNFGSALVAAAPVEDPYLRYVHPDLRERAAMVMKMFGSRPSFTPANLPTIRKGAAAYSRPPRLDMPWRRVNIPAANGSPAVEVLVVNDKPGKYGAGILHMHGGGYIIGSAEGELFDIQELARVLDCCVVSVNYRLAPETTYVGSIEDNYAGLKWLYSKADVLGVDRSKIAVYGGSAGGGHAALLAITARDRGEIPIAFQCLIYPMLDDRTGSTRQVPSHVGRIIWAASDNRFGWESFLGTQPGKLRVPTRAVPARNQSLRGLPPAFIGVGAIDLFHDEDVEYARSLNDAAVPTELVVVPGAFHGFDGVGVGTKIVDWFNAAKVDALRRGLRLTQD